MAKIGWRSGEAGQGVCPMPEGGELVCGCPLTPMAIAIQTLGTCPFGLCSPLSGKDVPGVCQGTVKVAGSCGNAYTTASQTVTVLMRMFSANGLPEQLVTDNGPQFVSEEFASFCRSNGIKHICVSPYHPS